MKRIVNAKSNTYTGYNCVNYYTRLFVVINTSKLNNIYYARLKVELWGSMHSNNSFARRFAYYQLSFILILVFDFEDSYFKSKYYNFFILIFLLIFSDL